MVLNYNNVTALATEDFVEYLNNNGLVLRACGDRIKCINMRNIALDSILHSEIGRRKQKLLNYLKNDLIPLSLDQLTIVDVYNIDHASIAYNIPTLFKLKGNIDFAALNSAIQYLLHRHEIIRAQLYYVDGKAYQKIREVDTECDVEIRQTDLKTAQDEIAQYLQLPFNLEQDRLFRIKLYKLNDGTSLLLVIFHYLITDCWSLGKIIFYELGIIYKNIVKQLDPYNSLAQIRVSFLDYVYWQQAWYKTETAKQQLEYWQQKLCNLPLLTRVPHDRICSNKRTFNGSVNIFNFPSISIKHITELAESNSVTLYVYLMTIFYIVLYKYIKQEELVIGAPVPYRENIALAHTVGFVAKVLPFHVKVNNDFMFTDLLKLVKQTYIDAHKHGDVAWVKIIEVLGHQISDILHPLYQIFFHVHSPEVKPKLELPGIVSENIIIKRNASRFDMVFDFYHDNNKLYCKFEYNTDLYDESTIENIIRDFELITNKVVLNQNLTIEQLCNK